MEELSKLYYSFWSQFCSAYQEGYVPTEAEFPYLTYSVVRPAFGERTITGVNIYDRSESFVRLRTIGRAIEQEIPQAGIILSMPGNSGTIALFRSNPFIQSRPLPASETRENVRADYLSIEVLGHLF